MRYDIVNEEATSIIVRNRVFSKIADKIIDANKYVIISDSNVSQLYLEDLENSLLAAGKECFSVVFPEGEKSKSIKIYVKIHQEINSRLDRDSCIIALGGGVTGDLAGFVAATYLRGIKFVQIPTTLLAMVDSSIGGKLGINFMGLKNNIGIFKNPDQIFIDPELLISLERKDFINGLSEVVKYAIIKDLGLFEFLKENRSQILCRNTNILAAMIESCVMTKVNIVEKDYKESGERKILNFGHTIGHALEAYLDYDISHGEAVSIGMIAASSIARKLSYIDDNTFIIIRDFIKSFNLPIFLSDKYIRFPNEDMYNLIKRDKKVIDGNILFVLPTQIGYGVCTDEATKRDIFESLDFIKN